MCSLSTDSTWVCSARSTVWWSTGHGRATGYHSAPTEVPDRKPAASSSDHQAHVPAHLCGAASGIHIWKPDVRWSQSDITKTSTPPAKWLNSEPHSSSYPARVLQQHADTPRERTRAFSCLSRASRTSTESANFIALRPIWSLSTSVPSWTTRQYVKTRQPHPDEPQGMVGAPRKSNTSSRRTVLRQVSNKATPRRPRTHLLAC